MNDFLDTPNFQTVSERPRTLIQNKKKGRWNRLSFFTIRAKLAMLEQRTSISDIAKAIGRSRVVTSQAINHGLHEPTRRLVAKHLGIAA